MKKLRQSAGFISSVAMAQALHRPSSVRLASLRKMFLNLGEGLFDRVEIGAVGREKPKLGSGGFNRDFDGGALVSAEVVHDHDVAGAQRPDQFLFDVIPRLDDRNRSSPHCRSANARPRRCAELSAMSSRSNRIGISCELLSVDRSIEDARRGQAVVAQGGKEGCRFPMTEWRVADQPLADLTPAIARRHVRGRPGFIDENELPRVEGRLLLPPCGAGASYVRTLLLGRAKRFFIADPQALQKPTDGRLSHLDASLVQLLPQFEEGRARRLLDELPHDGLVLGELRLLVAAEITRPETSRRLKRAASA